MKSRTQVRREMAFTAFVAAIATGALLISAALIDDGVAKRVEEISGFLSLWFGGLYGIVGYYWHVSSADARATLDATGRSPDTPTSDVDGGP